MCCPSFCVSSNKCVPRALRRRVSVSFMTLLGVQSLHCPLDVLIICLLSCSFNVAWALCLQYPFIRYSFCYFSMRFPLQYTFLIQWVSPPDSIPLRMAASVHSCVLYAIVFVVRVFVSISRLSYGSCTISLVVCSKHSDIWPLTKKYSVDSKVRTLSCTDSWRHIGFTWNVPSFRMNS